MAPTARAGHDPGVDDLTITIGGEGAEPATVPAHLIAGLVTSYLTALYHVAEAHELAVPVLCGGELVPGSFAFKVPAGTPAIERANDLLITEVASNDNRPYAAVRRAVQAITAYDARWGATVRVGDAAPMTIPATADTARYIEESEVRGHIIGSRTEPSPALYLRDEVDGARFKLRCSRDLVLEHAGHVDRLVDVTATLRRDDDMKIIGGEAHSVELIEENWTVDGLLAWFSDEFQIPQ